MSADLSVIAEKVEAGERLSAADVRSVVSTTDLLALGTLADDARRRRHGNRVTFVRVAEVPVEFGGADRIPPSAGEVRILGRAPDLDTAVRRVRALVERAGDTPVTGFALDELDELSGQDHSQLTRTLTALRESGLALIAEVRAERLDDWHRALAAADAVGLAIARITVGAGDRSRHTLFGSIAALGAAARRIHALAPLPRAIGTELSTGYDDVRQVALARLLVDNIASIQVDWSLYGPKLAQVALTFGADDVDAVSPIDSLELGPRRAPLEEIRRNIRAAALVPVQRNGRFEALER